MCFTASLINALVKSSSFNLMLEGSGLLYLHFHILTNNRPKPRGISGYRQTNGKIGPVLLNIHLNISPVAEYSIT